MLRRCVVVWLVVAAGGCTPTAPPTAPGGSSSTPSAGPTRTDSPSSSAATPSPSILIELTDAAWTRELDRIANVPGVTVAVGVDGHLVYRHGDTPQALASNEKLLTSMAALELLGARYRLRTTAAIERGTEQGGVIDGDLWLVGGGDPTLDTGDLATLAARVAAAGITRVAGDVIADTTAFDRGWWAPGWLPGISRSYVARPVALRLSSSGTALEATTADAFREAIVDAGVAVAGGASTGPAPNATRNVASIASPPLGALLVHQNHESDNLYAELLTKELGREISAAASTAGGARVIARWAATQGAASHVRDGSGLSDQDRSSAADLVWLLVRAERQPWFAGFRRTLPGGGEGTLAGRLTGMPVWAKTGTLFVRPTSALSGYVMSADRGLVAFSVLTHGLPQASAEQIEDAVVRTLAAADVG